MSDLIDKQVVLDTIHRFFTEEIDKIPTKKTEDGEVLVIHKCQPLFEMNKAICKRIKALPSVPTERTGHWTHDGSHWKNRFICSECGYKLFDEPTNYCPNCGYRMVEPQESEDKE